jgi:hypothetical protein
MLTIITTTIVISTYPVAVANGTSQQRVLRSVQEGAAVEADRY